MSERGIVHGRNGPVARAAAVSEAGQTQSRLDYERYVTGMVSWLSNRQSAGASLLYRRMFGVGVMEWRVMAHLAIEPDCTAARIGRIIGLDKAAVSRTVTGLIGRGLVRTAGSEGRGRQLLLTEQGEVLHDRIHAVAMRREAALLAGFTEPERTVLRAMLKRLLAAVPAVPVGAESGAGPETLP